MWRQGRHTSRLRQVAGVQVTQLSMKSGKIGAVINPVIGSPWNTGSPRHQPGGKGQGEHVCHDCKNNQDLDCQKCIDVTPASLFWRLVQERPAPTGGTFPLAVFLFRRTSSAAKGRAGQVTSVSIRASPPLGPPLTAVFYCPVVVGLGPAHCLLSSVLA